jgi:hypothetical protein
MRLALGSRGFAVSHAPTDEVLADNRYVVVVVRILLSPQGAVLHGELVDATGQVATRFSGWQGLTRAIKKWLSSQH